MNDGFLTSEQKEDLIYEVRGWLGSVGIGHFKRIKKIFGTINTVWMEPDSDDMLTQMIPRNTDLQEGDSVRKYLKTLEMCKGWTDEDLQTRWEWIIEESIK